MKHRTRCSQKLHEHLQELSRKEDLEGLRAPLREYDLFPPDKDPSVAPITMEELKKLVRHWKLHETRGFWKMHPSKEDLVSALLEYMDDKEDQFSRRANPSRPTSSKPTRKNEFRANRRRTSNVDLSTFRVDCLKPYSGDLFSSRDCTEGLIYLSRQSIKNPGTAKASTQNTKNSRRGHGNSILSGDFLAVSDGQKYGFGDKKSAVTEEQVIVAERKRSQWRAIAVEIFRYSMDAGDEAEMIKEGALQVIDKINKSDQSTASLANLEMASYCGATLFNLACGGCGKEKTRALMMPPQQMIPVEAINVITTHHSSETIAMLLCVVTVAYLTGTPGGEDALVSTTLSVLGTAAAVDSPDCRKAAIAALVNLFPSAERNQLVEHVLPVLKLLAAANEIESTLLAIAAIYNLAFYDVPRIALVENATVTLIVGIFNTLEAAQSQTTVDVTETAPVQEESLFGETPAVDEDDEVTIATAAPVTKTKTEFDAGAAYHAIAESVLNLSCTVDLRERMIRDGAVGVLVDLDAASSHTTTKETIAIALSNLTSPEVSGLFPMVVEQGALPCLVKLSVVVKSTEARHRLAVALSNLSTETAYREMMITAGAHEALLHLSKIADPTAPTQSFILVALVNLLSLPQNQKPMIAAGLLPLLQRLYAADVAAQEAAKSAAKAYAAEQQKRRSRRGSNGATPRMSMNTGPQTANGATPAPAPPTQTEDVKRYCGMAVANIADDLSMHEPSTHEVVIDMMTKLASNDPSTELLRVVASAFAMFAFMNADADDNAKKKNQALLTNEVIQTILGLCSSKDATALKFAGIALNNLAQTVAFHDPLFENGVAGALLHLGNSRDDDVRRVCASTLHSLTSSSALEKTDAKTAKGVIRVVEALEKSRAPDIVNFCAATLFSLSCCAPHCQQLTSQAPILRRLFGMMRGGQESTQLYAARALCNLTCDEACVTTLLRERAIADFIAIAILRTNNEEVKGVCAECLFNVIRYDATRLQLLKEPHNVLWAISRLFRFCVDSERTQTIGALVVYNLSCEQATATTVMKTINTAETLAAVALHPDSQPKCWAAAALCNLSWTKDFAAQLVTDAGATHRPGGETGGKGIIRVLRTLVEGAADKDTGLVTTKCATALYNISRCDDAVRERLVDDGVTVLIDALLESPNPDVVELAAIVCYNISLVPGCEAALVDYQVATSLIKLLRTIVKASSTGGKVVENEAVQKRPKAVVVKKDDDDEDLFGSPDLEDDESPQDPNNDEQPSQPVETAPQAQGKFPMERSETLLLILGTVYNLTIRHESRAPLEAAGVSDACIAIAQFSDAPVAHLELVTATLQNSSWEADNHRSWIHKGVELMDTLAAIAQRDVSFAVSKDVATVVANLSTSVHLGEPLVDIGTVDLVALVVSLAKRRCPEEKEILLGLAATTVRNISTIRYGKYQELHPAWEKPAIEPMVQILADIQETAPVQSGILHVPVVPKEEEDENSSRLGDVVTTLYNILIVGSAHLASGDSLTTILTALFKRCKEPATRSLCAAALIARQGEKEAHFSDGSVSALRSAMQAEIAAFDAAAVAISKQLKQDKRDLKSGVRPDRLGDRFVPDGSKAIVSNKVQRIIDTPLWTSFVQDVHAVSQGLEAPPTQTMKLPKQPANPPKCANTKTLGLFRKILLLPSKVRTTTAFSTSSQVSATENASLPDRSSLDITDDSIRVPLRFDFRNLFPPLVDAPSSP